MPWQGTPHAPCMTKGALERNVGQASRLTANVIAAADESGSMRSVKALQTALTEMVALAGVRSGGRRCEAVREHITSMKETGK